MGRVFTNGPGDLSSIPGHVISKTLKMVLDTSLLNTLQYKVRIKSKMDFLGLVYDKILLRSKSITCLPSRLGWLNTPTAPLQKGKNLPTMSPGYDTKQSDGEIPVMLELLGMQSTPSLPLLPGPL